MYIGFKQKKKRRFPNHPFPDLNTNIKLTYTMIETGINKSTKQSI